MTGSQLLLAYIADLAFADPPWLPHPVRLFGFATTAMEKACRKLVRNPRALRAAGVLTALAISSGAGLGTWLLLKWIRSSSALAASAVAIYLAYTMLSVRELDAAGKEVLANLRGGRLESARSALAMIVGFCHYPDQRQADLRSLVASRENIDPDTILFGNGATQLLHLIPRYFKPRKAPFGSANLLRVRGRASVLGWPDNGIPVGAKGEPFSLGSLTRGGRHSHRP